MVALHPPHTSQAGIDLIKKFAELRLKDLADAEEAIRQFVAVPLTQGQYDALASFIVSLGSGAFRGSALLHKLNSGDSDGAADEIPRWTTASGDVLCQVKRRLAERTMFLTGAA